MPIQNRLKDILCRGCLSHGRLPIFSCTCTILAKGRSPRGDFLVRLDNPAGLSGGLPGGGGGKHAFPLDENNTSRKPACFGRAKSPTSLSAAKLSKPSKERYFQSATPKLLWQENLTHKVEDTSNPEGVSSNSYYPGVPASGEAFLLGSHRKRDFRVRGKPLNKFLKTRKNLPRTVHPGIQASRRGNQFQCSSSGL
jgi:hypothetical protein